MRLRVHRYMPWDPIDSNMLIAGIKVFASELHSFTNGQRIVCEDSRS
jgi:hypothetical protein